MAYYVYILRCKTGQLYTGYTNNVKRRISEHDKGTASRFTRSRLPVDLVYKEKCRNRTYAMQRELQIKKMARVKKMKLIILKSQPQD